MASESSPKQTVTVTYSHPGAQPPIYIAGTLTTPPWEPTEMDHHPKEADASELEFSKEFPDIQPGEYQYKFRLGNGDWWALDENAPTGSTHEHPVIKNLLIKTIVTDDAGFKNNLLVVKPASSAAAKSDKPSQSTEAPVGARTEEDIDTNVMDQATAAPQMAGEDVDASTEGGSSRTAEQPVPKEPESKAEAEHAHPTTTAATEEAKDETEVTLDKKDTEGTAELPDREHSGPGEKSQEDIDTHVQDEATAPTKMAADDFDGTRDNPSVAPQESPKDVPVEHASPIPITVVEKAPAQEQPLYGDIEAESLHEETSKRTADAEPDAVIESPEVPAQSEPKTPEEVPQIVVEKTDDEPAYGDDFGPDASPSQKKAHEMRESDAEPDEVVVRADSVGDANESEKFSADDLNAPLTPARRKTIAQALGYDFGEPITPRGEEANTPLFAHECLGEDDDEDVEDNMLSPVESFHRRRASTSRGSDYSEQYANSYGSHHDESDREPDEDDLNDPNLEDFPTDREEIMEELRRTESKMDLEDLDEDEWDEPMPQSPIRRGSSPQLHRVISQRSIPSSPLNAITEHDDEDPSNVTLPEAETAIATDSDASLASTTQAATPELRSPPTPPMTPKEPMTTDVKPSQGTSAPPTSPTEGAKSPVLSTDGTTDDVDIDEPTTNDDDNIRNRKPKSTAPLRSPTPNSMAQSKRQDRDGFFASFWRVCFGSWLVPLGRFVSSCLGLRGSGQKRHAA